MRKIILLLLISTVTMLFMSLEPKRDYSVKPDEFGVKYKEVDITTKDGLKLKGWLFSPEKKSGTMIVVSHDGNGNMSAMIEIASFFTSAGYNVLTYDYRGFGGSDDFKINNSMAVYPQFATDLDAAINFAHAYHDVNQVFVYGKGMGAALSIGACSGRRDVQKAIADSPWDELNNYQKVQREVGGTEVLIPLAYDKALLEPLFALAGKYASTSKYLLIHGTDDKIFTEKLMKQIAKVNSGNVEIHSVKKTTYATTFSSDKNAYFQAINDFLK